VTPTAAIAAVRDAINDADILPGGCHYPPQPAPTARSGQLVWASFDRPNELLRQQVWDLVLALYLVAPKLNESTWDVASIDPLVAPVADLFDPANRDGHTLGGSVNACDARSGGREFFQGYYAFRVDVRIKLRRFAA
jgi:hypothetical protein